MSEVDFCSFAILMASRNEASISVSSPPWPRETRLEAGAVRLTNSAAQIFRVLEASRRVFLKKHLNQNNNWLRDNFELLER
ncbi:MAG: hypothetical protein JOZ60_05910 [Verrucomicrobia bacterium]|nr:hypothetical protein [Verrucomicrobiota bacterium]